MVMVNRDKNTSLKTVSGGMIAPAHALQIG